MKLLVAVLSCRRNGHGHRGPEWSGLLRDAQRDTWLSNCAVDYRFFLGRSSWSQLRCADEVVLDVPDDYDSLPLKTLAMLDWAWARSYDFVFKCDDDTFCFMDRLLASGCERHDYVGFRKMSPYFGKPGIDFAQGGAGYCLSRKAIGYCVQGEASKRLQKGPEDLNVARILKMANIHPVHDQRFRPDVESWPRLDNNLITAHQCTPAKMREIHASLAGCNL